MEAWEQIPLDAEKGAKTLVAEYGDRLFGAAVLLCKDVHAAEDLVFRTFERTVEQIGRYDPARPFWNWLYAVMLNLFRMDARKMKAFVPEDATLVDDLAEKADAAAASVRTALSGADAAMIRDAVTRLPPSLRETIVLRYFEDKTLQEMADLMSVPTGTVKWRIHRAKARMAQILSFFHPETERESAT